jgi:pseudouridine-5'-phosphate glycosidase
VQVSTPVSERSPLPGFDAALAISAEVRAALDAGQPVVALESTLITHGFAPPRNLEVARAAERRIRDEGAVPATVAVRDGCIVVGLDDGELAALAEARAGKATRHNLAAAVVAGGWWGTTVAATMLAARAAGIRVFATGGIGGVHRQSSASAADRAVSAPAWDVSSDLDELARTPVAVVCAGPKAILDVPATIEYLETRGVPVVTVGSDRIPGFWSRESDVPAPVTARDEAEAARIVATHWSLGLESGILVCVPVPEADALPSDESRAAVHQATADADAAGIHGAALTPWVLSRVAEITDGRSVDANAALIANNASVAARLAARLAGTTGRGTTR